MPQEKKASSENVAAYDVRIEEVEARYLAAIKGHVTLQDAFEKIPPMLKSAWKFAEKANLHPAEPVIILYRMNPEHSFEVEGSDIEAGPSVAERFYTKGALTCSMTPKGTVLTTQHKGDYENIFEAHAAIHRWCSINKREVEGNCWEVYYNCLGETEDLVTDIYYLLA